MQQTSKLLRKCKNKINIPAECHLDFITSSVLRCNIIAGNASIYGYPLTPSKSHCIKQSGIGIYSSKGCGLELESENSGNFVREPSIISKNNTNTDQVNDILSILQSQQQETKNKPLYMSKNSILSQMMMKTMTENQFCTNDDRDTTTSTTRNHNNELQDMADSVAVRYFTDDQLNNRSDSIINTIYHNNINSIGPRCLILGPQDVGKSTLCITLINQLVSNWNGKNGKIGTLEMAGDEDNVSELDTTETGNNNDSVDVDDCVVDVVDVVDDAVDDDGKCGSGDCGIYPILIDLDPGQSLLSLPGTCAGKLIDNEYLTPFMSVSSDIDNYNGDDAKVETTNANEIESDFICYFGHLQPSIDFKLYNDVIYRLSVNIKKYILTNELTRQSGIIVNTCGLCDEYAFDSIRHIIHVFGINLIVVK